MKNLIVFKSPKEMVEWLMDNESSLLYDYYGRAWYYLNFQFKFKDISSENYVDGIHCLHLFGTGFYYNKLIL